MVPGFIVMMGTHQDLSKPASRTHARRILCLSPALTSAEKTYSLTELELSHFIWTVRKVRYMLQVAHADVPLLDYTCTVGLSTKSIF